MRSARGFLLVWSALLWGLTALALISWRLGNHTAINGVIGAGFWATALLVMAFVSYRFDRRHRR